MDIIDYYVVISLALNLTYIAFVSNSWYFKQECVILSQINLV
jgi:hypothetical protein